LQNYGLIEALHSYIEKIKEVKGIEFIFDYSNVNRLPVMTETIVYRVVCECINNTIKYANAQKINLHVDIVDDHLEVYYADNGKGFDIETVLSTRKGIGLLNMQSRIKSLNGTMSIESKFGIGTSISFKVKVT
jgi:signal transduction histidine kinase